MSHTTPNTKQPMLGKITNPRELGVVTKAPGQANGNLATVFGNAPFLKWDGEANTPTCVGHGAVQGAEQFLLTFRLQVGKTMFYWFADPHDPEIHALLDSWADAGYMSVMLQTSDKLAVLGRDYPTVPREIKALCSSERSIDVKRFLRCVTEVVSSGQLRANATSEIPSISQLENVYGFLLLSRGAQVKLLEEVS